MARKLELHGYYFDGKKSWIMYINTDGKIIMKEDKNERKTQKSYDSKI